jgi:hypothetical protein
MLIGGLLAKLHPDYVEPPIDPQRLYAAESVAAYYGIPLKDALALMDSSDYLALVAAETAAAEGAIISGAYH